MNYKIAILFHESDRVNDTKHYAISALADTWRRDGHIVIYLFGIRNFVPADLVLVHIDLSVVPDEYITFSEQYPIVLNGKVKDIRKSSFSPYLIQSNDPYPGPVFIKTNFNFAGVPETYRLWKLPFPFSHAGYYLAKGFKIILHSLNFGKFCKPADYLQIDSLGEIPVNWFKRNDIVIQRFCPEMEDGLYHTRFYVFLGGRYYCECLSSPVPVVNSRSAVRTEYIDVHPEIERLRQELKFDYGKFDYVMHEGVPVLLDINKTIGVPKRVTPELEGARKHCAEGLYSYFR